MAKLTELGEFVRSASSTIEAPVVRKLTDAFQQGNGSGRSAGKPAAPRKASPAKPSAPSPQAARPAAPTPGLKPASSGPAGGTGAAPTPGPRPLRARRARRRPRLRAPAPPGCAVRAGAARVHRAPRGSGRVPQAQWRQARRDAGPASQRPSHHARSGRRPGSGRRALRRAASRRTGWRSPSGRASLRPAPGQQPLHLRRQHRHVPSAGAPSGWPAARPRWSEPGWSAPAGWRSGWSRRSASRSDRCPSEPRLDAPSAERPRRRPASRWRPWRPRW